MYRFDSGTQHVQYLPTRFSTRQQSWLPTIPCKKKIPSQQRVPSIIHSPFMIIATEDRIIVQRHQHSFFCTVAPAVRSGYLLTFSHRKWWRSRPCAFFSSWKNQRIRNQRMKTSLRHTKLLAPLFFFCVVRLLSYAADVLLPLCNFKLEVFFNISLNVRPLQASFFLAVAHHRHGQVAIWLGQCRGRFLFTKFTWLRRIHSQLPSSRALEIHAQKKNQDASTAANRKTSHTTRDAKG